MKIFNWKEIDDIDKLNEIASFLKKGSALSIGCFDGPHKGHKVLFDNVLSNAKKKKLIPGLVTFIGHPSVKSFASYLGDISTLAQRIVFFEKTGFEFVLLIDFSDEFSKIEGTDFLTKLKVLFNMKVLVEGTDFRCGHNGACKKNQIAAFCDFHNIEAVFPSLLQDECNERISSSFIRECIRSGEIDRANRMLCLPYSLDFSQIRPKVKGGAYYFPKSKVIQVLPESGVYNVFVNTSGRLRARLEVGSEEILVEPAANGFSLIPIVEFINKE